jgi:hypothetical protein
MGDVPLNPFYHPLPGARSFSVDTDGERFLSEVEKIIYYMNGLGAKDLGISAPLHRANLPERFGSDVPAEVVKGLATHLMYYFGSIVESYVVAFFLHWNEPAPGLTRAVIVPGGGELGTTLVAVLTTQLQRMFGPALRMDEADATSTLPDTPPLPGTDGYTWDDVFDWFYRAPRYVCPSVSDLLRMVGKPSRTFYRQKGLYESVYGEAPMDQSKFG